MGLDKTKLTAVPSSSALSQHVNERHFLIEKKKKKKQIHTKRLESEIISF